MMLLLHSLLHGYEMYMCGNSARHPCDFNRMPSNFLASILEKGGGGGGGLMHYGFSLGSATE